MPCALRVLAGGGGQDHKPRTSRNEKDKPETPEAKEELHWGDGVEERGGGW